MKKTLSDFLWDPLKCLKGLIIIRLKNSDSNSNLKRLNSCLQHKHNVTMLCEAPTTVMQKKQHCIYIQIHHHTNNQVEIFLTGPRYWRSSANAAPPMPEAVAKQDLNAVPQTSHAKVNLNVNSFWIVPLSTSDKVVDLRISHVTAPFRSLFPREVRLEYQLEASMQPRANF